MAEDTAEGVITHYDEQYLRAHARQHSEQGEQMKRLRQSTVELVFGSLMHHGLRRIGELGCSQSHAHGCHCLRQHATA